MSTALVLHGYSRDNAGDGLLVDQTIEMIRSALGHDVAITLVASRPESFGDLGVLTIDARPNWRGRTRELRHCLRAIDAFDLVVGVGGGYLRGRYLREFFTTALIHLPQLRAAARVPQTVYLSQSVGPFPFGTRPLVRSMLRRLGLVMVRDDRSLDETGHWARRAPDLAILAGGWRPRVGDVPLDCPVISVRAVRGRLPDTVRGLIRLFDDYDTYVQSRVGSNNDAAPTALLKSRSVLTSEELLGDGGSRRVIVAVRLHAALMALRAGHYVVHLAYERKGYGAFDDLDLQEFVHSAFKADAEEIAGQVQRLVADKGFRQAYDARLGAALTRMSGERSAVIDSMRVLARYRAGESR